MNKLQKALSANAIFSFVSGLLLIILNNSIAQLFGTSNNTVFWVIGIALIYFTCTIFYEKKKQRRWPIIWIITQDSLWVLGSLFLLIFDPFKISGIGHVLIAVTAIIVLVLGITQLRALTKSQT